MYKVNLKNIFGQTKKEKSTSDMVKNSKYDTFCGMKVVNFHQEITEYGPSIEISYFYELSDYEFLLEWVINNTKGKFHTHGHTVWYFEHEEDCFNFKLFLASTRFHNTSDSFDYIDYLHNTRLLG